MGLIIVENLRRIFYYQLGLNLNIHDEDQRNTSAMKGFRQIFKLKTRTK